MTTPNKPPKLSHAQHRALRHLPQVVDHMERIARQALAQSGKSDLYEIIVQDDPTTKRPRVYIAPKGIEGVLDDAANSTILKMQAAMRGAR